MNSLLPTGRFAVAMFCAVAWIVPTGAQETNFQPPAAETNPPPTGETNNAPPAASTNAPAPPPDVNQPPPSSPSTEPSQPAPPSFGAPPPLASAPSLLSNSASSTFLEKYPGLSNAPMPQPLPPRNLTLPLPETPPHPLPEARPPSPEAMPEAFHVQNGTSDPDNLPNHLLVVYNEQDPDSHELALYYAKRRNIPPERVFGLSCPNREEITRTEFENTIRQPLTTYLNQKGWLERHGEQIMLGGLVKNLLVATRNDIWAMVLMRGMPLKIADDPTDAGQMEAQPELQANGAAVDSELTLLPIFGLPHGGFVPNGFFDEKSAGTLRPGPDLARRMVLVTRLDAPKPEQVRRMIDDSIYAESNRLVGLAVVDTRGLTDVANGYTSGDVWLRDARDALLREGMLIRFDETPDVLPPTEPCNHVAVYLGWYRETAFGPWVTPPDRFVRGAVAYHLHSFSANTIRSVTQAWVGPLIAHGAAATMGNVYEPFLALTPHEDIFIKRLLMGHYFAEASWASERGLSWMTTMVGDPLYRPFREPIRPVLNRLGSIQSSHDEWLMLQRVERVLNFSSETDKEDLFKRSLNTPGLSPIGYEGLGDLILSTPKTAASPMVEKAYTLALGRTTEPIDRIRIGLKLASYYNTHQKEARALAEMNVLRELYPAQAKRFGVPDPLVPTSSPAGTPGDHPPGKAAPSLSKPPRPSLPPRALPVTP